MPLSASMSRDRFSGGGIVSRIGDDRFVGIVAGSVGGAAVFFVADLGGGGFASSSNPVDRIFEL